MARIEADPFLIPVGPILSIPFDNFFHILLHYIPPHVIFLFFFTSLVGT